MTPYPLSKSDPSTKVLITLFLATMLVSIAVAELNVYDKVKWTPGGVVARYGPDPEPPPVTEAPPASSGDDLPLETGSNAADQQLPLEGDTLVARMNTFTLLVDVTHPHVFELPVVIFVLAHFLMRTRAATWFKLANYALSFGGIAAFLSTPWLVRYVSVSAAPLLLAGAIAVGVTSLVMILISIVDMWLPYRRSGRAPSRAAQMSPAPSESQ
jgi:hypothetical protein